MRGVLLPLLCLVSGVSSARSIRPIRIAVLHADPYAVKAMLEGQPIVSPEVSTVLRLMGQGAAASAAQSAINLLMGGRLFVNPTDNSLWWYLDPNG